MTASVDAQQPAPEPVKTAKAVAQTNTLVAKLWNYCNVLRDNGMSTIEYVEQLSYLLFLKMVDEIENDPWDGQDMSAIVPAEYNWKSLVAKRGPELEKHYRAVLEHLGSRPDTTIGTIFADAQNRITKPALLEKLVVDLIGRQDWSMTGTDLKGDAYEGLLNKGASDTKTGAGQYFTPRPSSTPSSTSCSPVRTTPSPTRPAVPAASSSPPTPTSATTT